MFKALLEAAMGNEAPEMPSDEDLDDDDSEEVEEGEPPQRTSETEVVVVEQEQTFDDIEEEEMIDYHSAKEEEDEEYKPESEVDSEEEREFWGERRWKRNKSNRRRMAATKGTKPAKKKPKRKKKLPPELAMMLGEANMHFVEHRYDDAVQILKTFIKKMPTVPDPYHTLGMIYEDLGDRTKAVQFYLIACTLTKKDSELWKRVGKLALDEGQLIQARFCLRRAVSINPKDKEAFSIRAKIYNELEDYIKAAEAYKKILALDPSDLSIYLRIAECYHMADLNEQAIKCLSKCVNEAFKTSSTQILREYGLHAVNMLSDLYISLSQYQNAINIIQTCHDKYCLPSQSSTEDVSAQPSSGITDEKKSCEPASLPLDIAVKFGICNLHMGNFSIAESMFNHLFKHEASEYGDLYIDVADSYIEINNHCKKALAIFDILVKVEEFNNEVVWSKIGTCYESLENYWIALDFYERALHQQLEGDKISPELVLKAMKLCGKLEEPCKGLAIFEQCVPEIMHPPIRPRWAKKFLLEQNKKNKISSKVNEFAESSSDSDEHNQDKDGCNNTDEEEERHRQEQFDPDYDINAMANTIRLKLLIEWSYLKELMGEHEAMCQVGVPIVLKSLRQPSKTLRRHKFGEESVAIFNGEASGSGLCALKLAYLVDLSDASKRDDLSGMVARISNEVLILSSLTENEYFRLVITVAKCLSLTQNHVAAIEILTEIHGFCRKISDADLCFEIRMLAIVIALEFNENRMAYECARLNLLEDPTNIGYWNLFCRIISVCGGVYSCHQKFLAKILQRYPSCPAAVIMAGHHSSTCDFTRLTIGEYTMANELCTEQNALVLLCLGIAFLNHSMIRTVYDRQESVAKAFAILTKYASVRVDTITGLDSKLAQIESTYNIGRGYQQLELYHLAIPMYEQVLAYFEPPQPNIPSEYQLCREAAFNLSLIYNESGASDLSRILLQKYLTLT